MKRRGPIVNDRGEEEISNVYFVLLKGTKKTYLPVIPGYHTKMQTACIDIVTKKIDFSI